MSIVKSIWARHEQVDRFEACNTAWQSKVIDAARRISGDGNLDKIRLKIAGVERQVETVKTVAQLLLAAKGGKIAQIRHDETTLASQLTELGKQVADGQKKLSGLAGRLKLRDPLVNPEISDLKGKLDNAADATVLVSSILFANKPAKHHKIASTVRKVTTAARAILALTSPSLTGLALSGPTFDVAGAAMGLSGLLGGNREDVANAMVVEQLTALRESIGALRIEMHERFDQLEAMITKLDARINERFDRLDQRLDRIEARLSTIQSNTEIIKQVQDSGLLYLLRADFKRSYGECLEGIGSVVLSLEKASECLSAFYRHGIDVARLDAITGAAFGVTPIQADAELRVLRELVDDQHFGFLLQFLKKNVDRTPIDPAVMQAFQRVVPASPDEWIAATETYLNLLERTPDLATSSGRRFSISEIVRAERPRITRLVEVGRQTVLADRMAKDVYVPALIDRYKAYLRDYLKKATDEMVLRVASENLGIIRSQAVLEWGMLNEEGTGGYDGRHWFIPACYKHTYWVPNVGPRANQRVFIEIDRTYKHVRVHNRKHADAESLAFTATFCKSNERQIVWREIPVEAAELRKARTAINHEFLLSPLYKVASSPFPAANYIKMKLPESLKVAATGDEFKRLVLLKSVIVRLISLGLDGQQPALLRAVHHLQKLPASPEDLIARYGEPNFAYADSTVVTPSDPGARRTNVGLYPSVNVPTKFRDLNLADFVTAVLAKSLEGDLQEASAALRQSQANNEILMPAIVERLQMLAAIEKLRD
jgi:hypothetical protein